MDRPAADEALNTVGYQFLSREYGKHTWDCTGGAQVNSLDKGVCMRATYKDGIYLSGPREVVGVSASTRDEPEVFLALDGSANQRCSHDGRSIPITKFVCDEGRGSQA